MGDMQPRLKARGGRWYHLSERDGRRLSLSKASLGEFVYELLKIGGELHQLWPFNSAHDRSPVYPVVAMTPEMAEAFERRTGFALVDPPTVHLNRSAG